MYTTHITPLENGNYEYKGTLAASQLRSLKVTTKAYITSSCFYVFHTHHPLGKLGL